MSWNHSYIHPDFTKYLGEPWGVDNHWLRSRLWNLVNIADGYIDYIIQPSNLSAENKGAIQTFAQDILKGNTSALFPFIDYLQDIGVTDNQYPEMAQFDSLADQFEQYHSDIEMNLRQQASETDVHGNEPEIGEIEEPEKFQFSRQLMYDVRKVMRAIEEDETNIYDGLDQLTLFADRAIDEGDERALQVIGRFVNGVVAPLNTGLGDDELDEKVALFQSVVPVETYPEDGVIRGPDENDIRESEDDSYYNSDAPFDDDRFKFSKEEEETDNLNNLQEEVMGALDDIQNAYFESDTLEDYHMLARLVLQTYEEDIKELLQARPYLSEDLYDYTRVWDEEIAPIGSPAFDVKLMLRNALEQYESGEPIQFPDEKGPKDTLYPGDDSNLGRGTGLQDMEGTDIRGSITGIEPDQNQIKTNLELPPTEDYGRIDPNDIATNPDLRQMAKRLYTVAERTVHYSYRSADQTVDAFGMTVAPGSFGASAQDGKPTKKPKPKRKKPTVAKLAEDEREVESEETQDTGNTPLLEQDDYISEDIPRSFKEENKAFVTTGQQGNPILLPQSQIDPILGNWSTNLHESLVWLLGYYSNERGFILAKEFLRNPEEMWPILLDFMEEEVQPSLIPSQSGRKSYNQFKSELKGWVSETLGEEEASIIQYSKIKYGEDQLEEIEPVHPKTVDTADPVESDPAIPYDLHELRNNLPSVPQQELDEHNLSNFTDVRVAFSDPVVKPLYIAWINRELENYFTDDDLSNGLMLFDAIQERLLTSHNTPHERQVAKQILTQIADEHEEDAPYLTELVEHIQNTVKFSKEEQGWLDQSEGESEDFEIKDWDDFDNRVSSFELTNQNWYVEDPNESDFTYSLDYNTIHPDIVERATDSPQGVGISTLVSLYTDAISSKDETGRNLFTQFLQDPYGEGMLLYDWLQDEYIDSERWNRIGPRRRFLVKELMKQMEPFIFGNTDG